MVWSEQVSLSCFFQQLQTTDFTLIRKLAKFQKHLAALYCSVQSQGGSSVILYQI